MAQTQTIEGTWEELASHAEEFRGKKLRLTVVAEDSSAVSDQPQSLADLLSDFIGCVAGSGANNSNDTGAKFTDYLAQKHQDHRL